MKVLLVALMAVISFNAAHADQEVRLGETYLSNRPDPDYIDFTSRYKRNGECGLTHIKLRILGDTAEIYRVVAVYGNGMRDELQIRKNFEPGSESRWIDLNGSVRCVEGLYIYGQSGTRRPRETRVVILGLRDGRDSERRAVIMGRTEVKGNDKDSVDFGRNKAAVCGVTKLSVGAEQGGVELKWVMLNFKNGTTQTYNFYNQNLSPGERTRWIDLVGDQRCITSAVFKAESHGYRAYVNFFGLIEN